MAYETIPPSQTVGAVVVSGPLTGTGTAGNPIVIPAASAATAGTQSIVDFNRLNTAPLDGLQRAWYSIVIDLKVIQTVTLIAPIGYRLRYSSFGFEIKATTAPTVSPTFSIGANSPNFNNAAASQTIAALTTNPVETILTAASVSPVPALDLTTSGLVFNITTGATATTLTAVLFVIGWYMPV